MCLIQLWEKRLKYKCRCIILLGRYFWVVENEEEKFSIKLLNNKYIYENFNLNFSLQNKELQRILNFLIKIININRNLSFMKLTIKVGKKEVISDPLILMNYICFLGLNYCLRILYPLLLLLLLKTGFRGWRSCSNTN